MFVFEYSAIFSYFMPLFYRTFLFSQEGYYLPLKLAIYFVTLEIRRNSSFPTWKVVF